MLWSPEASCMLYTAQQCWSPGASLALTTLFCGVLGPSMNVLMLYVVESLGLLCRPIIYCYMLRRPEASCIVHTTVYCGVLGTPDMYVFMLYVMYVVES